MTQIKAIYSMTYLPELTELKTKVNKWDVIKLKRLCIAKETISKVKRQPSEWEEITSNETNDKVLISKNTSSPYHSIPEKQTSQSNSGKKM